MFIKACEHTTEGADALVMFPVVAGLRLRLR